MQMTLQSTFILSRVVTCPMVLIKGSLLNLFVFSCVNWQMFTIPRYLLYLASNCSYNHRQPLKLLVSKENPTKI